MDCLYLNASSARRRFKKLLGNANHLFITLLVGARGIQDGLLTKVPAELHAAWNPRNASASAKRSRRLALEMGLARGTDALDAYITWAIRRPTIITMDSLRGALDGAGRSVTKRVIELNNAILSEDDPLASMLLIMIAWRNQSVHSATETSVDDVTWARLEAKATWINETFRGLDVRQLRSHFQSRKSPALKEVTSLIAATQLAVELFDKTFLSNLDLEKYIRGLIENDIVSRLENDDAQDRAHQRKLRVANIWGRDQMRRAAAVRSYLINLGFSPTRKVEYARILDAERLESLACADVKAMIAFLAA